ncbi:Coatomer subunit zeta [Plasmodiophora brassicae]|uniref:Coatomer subunit zeta n=1 Tax=Plasmodiophora brassicae TaxID=37360 RepID=A0A0G4IPZ9_PLABS|nr:hypothetical protein PBRA_000632 [Plasmodiophora brassicae]SPQ97594.1 unnamed protein product [Plasmodiophora brassicae]
MSIQSKVKAAVVLDGQGTRIGVKYFDPDLLALDKQLALERAVFGKTSRILNARKEGEVVMFDQYVTVFKFYGDAFVYVIGAADENELVLHHVLVCLEESLTSLLRVPIDRQPLIDNLDVLLLTIDEILDDGIILETDSVLVVDGVAMKGADRDAPIAEQSLAQAFQTARETFAKTFR